MMGRALATLSLFFLMAASARAQQEVGGCIHSDPSPTRLSSDDVRFSGAIRLMDLLRLMPEWHTVSTDMYLWDVAPGVFSLPEWDPMTVMIDGQPLTATFLGTSYLNAFPLDISAVDSVDVFEGPVLCDGVFAPSGLIHLYTRRERSPGSIGGSAALASESGEPGPYRFAPPQLPNVDRSGPAASAFAAFAVGGGQGRLSVVSDEHHLTAPLLRPRVQRVYKSFPPPRHFVRGQRADLLIRQPERRFSASVEHARFDHFRYMPSLGSEWPLVVNWFRAGGHAHTHLWRGLSVYASGETTEFETDAYRDSPYIAVRWRTARWQWQGGAMVRFARGFASLGMGGYRDAMRMRSGSFAAEDYGGTWHAATSVALSDAVRVYGFGHLVRESGRMTHNGSLTGAWTPLPQQTVRLTLTGARIPPYRTGPFLYRASQGLQAQLYYDHDLDMLGMYRKAPVKSVLDEDLVPDVRLFNRHAERLTASLSWRFDHRLGAVTLSGTRARFAHFPVARYALSFVAEEDMYMKDMVYFISRTDVAPNTSGSVTRLAVEVEARPIRYASLRLYYAHTLAESENAPFETAWSQVPVHRGYGSVTYAPHHRASIHARLSWESWSEWPDYTPIAEASGAMYPDRLPALALLDVGVTKRIWNDHMDVSLLLTNVLNRSFQRHPAGKTEAFSLLARVQLRV